MTENDITVLIPCYNDGDSIESTVSQIKETFDTIKQKPTIIVINDGSKDNTADILKDIKDIEVITNPYNLGYGASLKKGLLKAKTEWILITDADGTYPIKDIPRLTEHMDQYDMIVGSRNGKNVNIPFFRKPAKWFIGKLANLMSGRKIPDINSGLRLFKRDMALQFYHLYPSRFSFTTTITLSAITNDYTVKYVPIDYYKRDGKSTIHPIKDFIGFQMLIFKIIMYFKPMRILYPLGGLFFIASILRAYRDYALEGFIGTFSLMLFLTAFQIVFLGTMAELIMKKK